jgi:dynein heavy chain 2
LIEKKQNIFVQDTDFIKLKIHPPVEDGSLSPIQSFLQLERYNGIQLVQIIHENLAALSKVIRGISLITNEIQEYAKDLLQNEVINLFSILSEEVSFPVKSI